jgi:DNA-binding MarR family transcriptional regulator
MKEPSLEDLSDELVLICVRLIRRLRALDRAPALSRPEASALAVLVFAGPVSLSELARHEGVRAPTITQLMKNLQERGLIRRLRDAADARVVRVTATAAGKKLFFAGQKRKLQPLVELLATLDADELAGLRSAMPTLRKFAAVGDR